MIKTKIEWCDFTWNPVFGCRNNCAYCYARKIAHRFGESFEPHWKEKNFNRKFPTKPSRIFVNSMSDIAFWESWWWTDVINKIKIYPQHQYLFLTKQPEIYIRLHNVLPLNCWFGTTITKNGFQSMPIFAGCINFISIEPILEQINLYERRATQYLSWIIIGAETGYRKDRVYPKLSWIENIVNYAKDFNISLFMKDSLKPIWGEKLIQDFPETGGKPF